MNVHVSPASLAKSRRTAIAPMIAANARAAATFPASGRFTKAQIAEITRGGGNVSVKLAKPAADPIITKIRSADAALLRYIEALNALNAAKNQLPERDRGWASVGPLDQMIPTFSHSDCFMSERNIDGRFARLGAFSRQEVRRIAAKLKSPGGQIRYELEQRLAHHRKMLSNLPKWREPLKKAFRAEFRRLAKVQRTVGLEQKRLALKKATGRLWKLTKEIRAMSPASPKGALALLRYVHLRSRDDLRDRFSQSSSMPAGLPTLLDRCLATLTQGVVLQ